MQQLIRNLNHRRIDAMRSFAVRVTKFLFDRRRVVPVSEVDRKILVLRLDNKIGDSITATGFMRELKKTFPQHELTVLADPATASVYKSSAWVDRILSTRKGLSAALKIYFQLRKEKYEFIINTSHILAPRVIFLVSCLKASRKLGFQSFDYRLFTDHISYNPNGDHITRRYEKTLQALRSGAYDLAYEFPLPIESVERAQKLKSRLLQKSTKLVVLNSFAGASLRSFNQHTSTQIAKQLLQQDPEVVVVSIGNKNDLPVAQAWAQEAQEPRWQCIDGMTAFYDNMALVSVADLVITPDTALVHIASALKVPLVAVFRWDGPENNSLIWAPLGTSCRLVKTDPDDSVEPDINHVQVGKILEAAKKELPLRSGNS